MLRSQATSLNVMTTFGILFLWIIALSFNPIHGQEPMRCIRELGDIRPVQRFQFRLQDSNRFPGPPNLKTSNLELVDTLLYTVQWSQPPVVTAMNARTGAHVRDFTLPVQDTWGCGLAYSPATRRLYVSTWAGRLWEVAADGSSNREIVTGRSSDPAFSVHVSGVLVYVVYNNDILVYNTSSQTTEVRRAPGQTTLCSLPGGVLAVGSATLGLAQYYTRDFTLLGASNMTVSTPGPPVNMRCSTCGTVWVTTMGSKQLHSVQRGSTSRPILTVNETGVQGITDVIVSEGNMFILGAAGQVLRYSLGNPVDITTTRPTISAQPTFYPWPVSSGRHLHISCVLMTIMTLSIKTLTKAV